MESGALNNFDVVEKKTAKFGGRKADERLGSDSKFCASLRVYIKTIFNVLQRQGRPSEFDAVQETTRATWDAASHDLYSVLFFTAS